MPEAAGARGEGDLEAPDPSPLHRFARAVVLLGLVAFGFFYLMLATGAASFIHGCNDVICGQLHQALFAAVAGISSFVAAYRLFYGRSSVAKVALLGTVPILIVHVILVLTDPNESIFFPLSSTPVPVIAGAVLLYKRVNEGGLRNPGT